MLELTCAAVQFFYLMIFSELSQTTSECGKLTGLFHLILQSHVSKSYVHILMFIESLYITFQNVFSALKLLEYLYESFS